MPHTTTPPDRAILAAVALFAAIVATAVAAASVESDRDPPRCCPTVIHVPAPACDGGQP